MTNDPPTQLMEICIAISEVGGSPVEYMGRSIREIEMWVKARNEFVKKRNEQIKGKGVE